VLWNFVRFQRKLACMVAERTLVRHKEARFEGLGCSECAWNRSYPKVNELSKIEPRENLDAAFHLHRCENHPMPGRYHEQPPHQAA